MATSSFSNVVVIDIKAVDSLIAKQEKIVRHVDLKDTRTIEKGNQKDIEKIFRKKGK